MKKVILFLFLVIMIPLGVFAQTNTEEKTIEDFKEKIANVVKKTDKAVTGFVTSNKDNIIKIKSDEDTTYDLKLDKDLTKYFKIVGATKKEIAEDDIEDNDYLIATGVLADQTVSANAIFVDEAYLVLSGKISEVDKENYTISVVTPAKETYTLDVETYTKQEMMNIKTLEVEKIGFSKIKSGDMIHFSVKRSPTIKDNHYSAEKILIIPQEYFAK